VPSSRQPTCSSLAGSVFLPLQPRKKTLTRAICACSYIWVPNDDCSVAPRNPTSASAPSESEGQPQPRLVMADRDPASSGSSAWGLRAGSMDSGAAGGLGAVATVAAAPTAPPSPGGRLALIPASRAEVFRDRVLLGLGDKRALMAFLNACLRAPAGQGPLAVSVMTHLIARSN
jgi:hypothetical protein